MYKIAYWNQKFVGQKINKMQKNNYESDATDTSNEDDNFTRKNLKNGIGAKKANALLARPNASAGYWLCVLLPLCFATNYLHELSPTTCATPPIYKWLTIAAISMAIESLCFFVYMFLDTAFLLKLFVSLCPGICSAFMYFSLLDKSWGYSVFWGFGMTFAYQNVYNRVMRGFPYCFSFGEAAILVQGIMLFTLNAILALPKYMTREIVPKSDFDVLNAIMMSALTSLLIYCVLLSQIKALRHPFAFYPLTALLLLAVTCIPVTEPIPIIALLNFITSKQSRIFTILFYLVLVGLTIVTISYQLRTASKATTRMRKIFHLLIVLVYVPGLLYECEFLFIATGVALAIFVVLELVRILQIPPLATALGNAFSTFSDEKDAGLLALTPFCLLIGCSLPIWIHPCACEKSAQVSLTHLAGILAVGVGDTAASVIGSRVGRTKWRNSSRSLEGTISFVVAVLIAAVLFYLSGYIPMSQSKWFVVIAAAFNTALVEAFTDQIDNLVLPLVFYGIVNLA